MKKIQVWTEKRILKELSQIAQAMDKFGVERDIQLEKILTTIKNDSFEFNRLYDQLDKLLFDLEQAGKVSIKNVKR